MTRYDRHILFTALAFVAVVLKDGEKLQKGSAKKVMKLTSLLGDFCTDNVPSTFSVEASSSPDVNEIECLVSNYIADLRTKESVFLDYDRQTLLKMYEELLIQKTRHEQQAFYLIAPSDMIASNILRLAKEQMRRENRE